MQKRAAWYLRLRHIIQTSLLASYMRKSAWSTGRVNIGCLESQEVELLNVFGVTQKDYWSSESWEGYQYALRTMLEMMWSQASGMSSANHGLFHRYNIEAVTLHGIKIKNSRPSYGFPEMGR